jgi:hypothetical protein
LACDGQFPTLVGMIRAASAGPATTVAFPTLVGMIREAGAGPVTTVTFPALVGMIREAGAGLADDGLPRGCGVSRARVIPAQWHFV